MFEPFEYNFSETEQYNGHRCEPQAVKGENAHEVQLLEDNLPLDTETPRPEAEAEEEVVEPQGPEITEP